MDDDLPGGAAAERTVLVVPVPEAAGVTTDPYVALLDPFLPPAEVDDGVLAELRELFGGLVPFAFVLGEQARFPSGSAYLPPEPAGVFRRIIHELRRTFPEIVGRATTLDSFVPHLAVPDDTAVPRPVEAHAREAELRVAGPDGVRVLARFRFGTSAA